MDRMKNFLVAIALLVVGLLVAFPPRAALAQPLAGDEVMSTISASISSSASVITAVSGKRLIVKACVLRSSTAGVVVFTDGDGGTALMKVYLAQDTNLVLDEKFFGTSGLTTTAGNGLYAVLSSATLSATFRVLRD